MKKNLKGITLIALVITIIILLILAGISISALSNQGLFNKSKDARDKSEIAREIEQIKMVILTVSTNNYETGDLPFKEFNEEMVKYKDVENVTTTDNINSSTLVSKKESKFKLSSFLMPVSKAVGEDESGQYAKIEYKTKRTYYVKLKTSGNPSEDKIGSIYEDPKNEDPTEEPKKDEDNDEDAPSATKENWFIYSYFNAEEYVKNNRWNFKDSTEFKNYYEQNKWEYSVDKDYLASYNYSGYIVDGFSEEGKKAITGGKIKNTIYIPSEYNDGTHGKANVISLGGGMSIDNQNYNEARKNVYECVKKMYLPSTIISVDRESLNCVSQFGTEIKYSGTPIVKYVSSRTFGSDSSGYTGGRYIDIPDSVEIFGVENGCYFGNYFSLGKNVKTLLGDYETIGKKDQIDVVFFKGTLEDAKITKAFTDFDIFSKEKYEINLIYCLKDNKIAIQEKNGDNFICKETNQDAIKTYLKTNNYASSDESAQNYIDALNVIIENAKKVF